MRLRVSFAAMAGLFSFAGLATSADLYTGWWRGREVTYRVVHAKAVWQGDMALGNPDDIPIAPPPALEPKSDGSKDASFIAPASRYLWPNGNIPFTIAASTPMNLQQQIADAIQAYAHATPIVWTARVNESNYVTFQATQSSAECGDSMVGMRGGQQFITLSLDPACDSAIHEMGHAIGLEHEMTRANRNFYVDVRYENIDKQYVGNFSQNLAQQDLLPYEYGSVMHYSSTGFSTNNLDTLDTIPLGIPIGQRAGLSAGDIEAIKTVYGQPSATTTVATNPAGLQIVIDGVAMTAPQTFDWQPGTQHTLDVPTPPQPGVSGVRYAFARWSNDGPRSQTVVASAANRILTANFATQYLVAMAANPAAGGTVTASPPSADGYYPQGTGVTVTAAANDGFAFQGWNGRIYLASGFSGNPVGFTVNVPNLNYTAAFSRAPLTTIASTIPGVTAVIDGKTVNLPDSLAWTPGSSHTLAIADTTQPSSGFGPPVRSVFLGWDNGGAASQTIAAGAGPTSITATWKRQFLVLTEVKTQFVFMTPANAGGTIAFDTPSSLCDTATAPDCYFDEGSSIQITAAPVGPYSFAGWTGDLAGTDATATLLVDGEKLVVANFDRAQSLAAAGIVGAANYIGGKVAPGEILTLFGFQMGPGPLTPFAAANGALATQVAGTRVLFDGVAAPLIYVSDSQIGAVVPYAVAGKTQTAVRIEYQGQLVGGLQFTLPVVPASPALFTLDSSGGGQGAILNQDGSVNSAANPAARGSVVSFFGTGEGATTPAGVDGRVAASVFPKPVMPVTVTIGGRPAQVQYAGAAPGDVAGVIQINATIPPDCPTGNVPIGIAVGDYASPDNVTVAVE